MNKKWKNKEMVVMQTAGLLSTLCNKKHYTDMKKILVLSITVYLYSTVCAQGNYERGYIITNQQDTITGWINLRTNKNNQKQCEFKPDLNAAAKIYLPQDIAGYRFTDNSKYYVSREIRLNKTPQKVFLEFLVKGIMNLYYYEDAVEYYFFENQDGKIEVISRSPERVENRVVYKDNKYIGQIRYLFYDYQPIAQKADKLKFNQKSMIDIVEEYHNEVCTTGESCIVFQNKHPDDKGLRCRISVYTGLQISNYAFFVTYSSDTYSSVTQTKSNISPVLGAQVNLLNPRWSKSFNIQLDASLSQIKGDLPETRYWYADIKSYESLASSFRLGAKYTYHKFKISPTAEAGVAYTYLKEKKDVNLLRHSSYGYYLAIGADYAIKTSHAFFIRLVYEDYPFMDMIQINGSDKMSLPHIKIGYTF